MSTPDETFRATLRVQTPEGEPTTLIVRRQGLGRAGRVWLTGNGGIKTTVMLTSQEAEQLAGLLWDASSALGTP
ncbi:MAG TPA: hypothetical protein VN327_05550 [Pseudonocardiaceae bacterium]|jgi:biotin-(acetyl-CoA carboxylase) ligase|nr:hypothetical protein [Pseudonocardiaceae bacterium]